MKKLICLTLTLIALTLTACQSQPKPDQQPYTTTGRYYTNGTVITSDGNEWSYDTDTISNKPSYNNEPVHIAFSDNGTPDNVYDDIILGLVLDRYTAIYDELEAALSEHFEVERINNTIHIISPEHD